LSTTSLRRADATKNRERLITEARALFSASDGAITLEAIAKAAGVGIGTLYRHFPTREALIEAVYRSELDALEAEAHDLLKTHPGFEAMRRWMDRYAQFVATKRAMHDALRVALTPRMGGVSEIRTRINATIAKFLAAGSQDGTIRDDVQPDDVALSLAGMVLAATISPDRDQMRRLLDLLMDGLRRRSQRK
jgi:AcrR family transcriptional regulator